MSCRYRATEPFWESFYDLSQTQKQSVRRAWEIFKLNPFDPRLRTHRIQRLSALCNRTVYSVIVEADLRVVFYIDGDTIWTIDVGTHRPYG